MSEPSAKSSALEEADRLVAKAKLDLLRDRTSRRAKAAKVDPSGELRKAAAILGKDAGLPNEEVALTADEARTAIFTRLTRRGLDKVEAWKRARAAIANSRRRRFPRSNGVQMGDEFKVRGYAAVYNKLSHDLGGFRERIAPGAFDDVLLLRPKVHLVWDHDTRYLLAGTKNKSLRLSSVSRGLRFDAEVPESLSYGKDLRLLMDRGLVGEGSFAFPPGEVEWSASPNGDVIRTIKSIDALYDVTITAAGAYPQTVTELVG